MQHNAFTELSSTSIDSLNVTIDSYEHKKTGALHYHINTDNNENVFMVAFRTVPQDDTGVAHILEHTVLCGSKKYPVRDPFFMMIRRSLNTFMNAFTSSDWTAYPFASQNKKDFNNLLDVYLDAVFFSRLHPLDFAQEGHRLEFSEPNNPQSEITYKGVVFNEMKGALSSTNAILWHTLSRYLFPTSTYHFNSGGDPEHIVQLNYEQLLDFYKSHYHPSNAIFMTYGNISAYEHQCQFEEKALNQFDRLAQSTIQVANEKRYYAPVRIEECYPISQDETKNNKTHHVIAWLLGKSTDLEHLFKAQLMSSLLLDNSSCPLLHALETTDLGTSPSPLCGLEDSHREISFVCGIEGSTTENGEDFEALVLSVLEKIADQGLPLSQVKSVLHQLEISQREIGGDGYPYGLQLMLAGLPAAIHYGDVPSVLNLDPVLKQLQQDIENPNFIKNLVKELLLDNPHRVRLTLKPDETINQRKIAAEQDQLAAIKASLSQEQAQKLIDQTEALAQRQLEVDDQNILPKVGIHDIPKTMHIPTAQIYQLAANNENKLPLNYYCQGTNGLVYQQIIIDLPNLNKEQMALLPIYSTCLTEVGCADKNYIDTQAKQASIAGSLTAFTSFRSSINDEQKAFGHLTLSGKGLVANQSQLSNLMQETLNEVHFDELDRIKELITQIYLRKEQSITQAGHSLALIAANSGMSPVAQLSHQLSGFEGIRSLKELVKSLDDEEKLKDLCKHLTEIHQRIQQAPRQFLVISETQYLDNFKQTVKENWITDDTCRENFSPIALPAMRQQIKQFWIGNTAINFCAKSYPAVPYNHNDSAALTVLGHYLKHHYLHRTIREQGGAYGAGASFDPNNASFRFHSYRDPRLLETLNDFDQAINWLLTTTDQPANYLEQAILSVVSDIDKPSSPAGSAKQAFHSELYGRTAEIRQEFRSNILIVTLDDLKRVCEKYLIPEQASIAVLTSEQNIDKASDIGATIEKIL